MVSSGYSSSGNYAYRPNPWANTSRSSTEKDADSLSLLSTEFTTNPSMTTLSQPTAADAGTSASAASTISASSTERLKPSSTPESEPVSETRKAEKKEADKGGIGNFFKGILNGFKSLGEFMLNPKNWLLIIPVMIICSFFPMVGVALAIAGVAMGGIKFGKGVASGNMEQAGEGVFDMGIWTAGGISSLKAAKSARSAAAGAGASQAASGQAAANGSRLGGLAKKVPSAAWNVVSNSSTAQSLTDWFQIG
jgi:hypothetical protein